MEALPDEAADRLHGLHGTLGMGRSGSFPRVSDLDGIGIQRSEQIADEFMLPFLRGKQFKEYDQIVCFRNILPSFRQDRLEVFLGALMGVETDAVRRWPFPAAEEVLGAEEIFLSFGDPFAGVRNGHKGRGRSGGCHG